MEMNRKWKLKMLAQVGAASMARYTLLAALFFQGRESIRMVASIYRMN
jgi:hypothetical protein